MSEYLRNRFCHFLSGDDNGKEGVTIRGKIYSTSKNYEESGSVNRNEPQSHSVTIGTPKVNQEPLHQYQRCLIEMDVTRSYFVTWIENTSNVALANPIHKFC